MMQYFIHAHPFLISFAHRSKSDKTIIMCINYISLHTSKHVLIFKDSNEPTMCRKGTNWGQQPASVHSPRKPLEIGFFSLKIQCPTFKILILIRTIDCVVFYPCTRFVMNNSDAFYRCCLTWTSFKYHMHSWIKILQLSLHTVWNYITATKHYNMREKCMGRP